MALIIWNSDLSVNIKGFDWQHQKLISVINQLHSEMTKGQSNQNLSRILNDLIAYTKTHFKSEENLFIKFDYPDGQKHKEAHDEFIAEIKRFISKYQDGKTNISFELIAFLNKWLVEHIKKMDKSYSNFLNNKGIS